jgi:predicted SprT family Zn-dependent metalloprotease
VTSTETAVMSRAEATTLTVNLLCEHGLTPAWGVTFNRARRAAGTCNYRAKTITLSLPLLAQRSYQDSLNTITHEVAHALTPGHNHDRVWQFKHRELGGDGQRCFAHEDHTAPWIATCSHGKVYSRYRAPKNPAALYSCRCEFNAPKFSFVRNPNVSR